MLKFQRFFLIFSLILWTSNPAWTGARKPTGTKVEKEEIKEDIPVEEEEIIPAESLAFFYIPHPEGNAQKLIKVFTDYPDFKATLIFPSNYFNSEARQALIEEFRLLVKSEQIEMALVMDNEPNLPLIGNLRLAEKDMGQWGVSFEWPEDVAAQVARSVGEYLKKWEQQPHGLFPPYYLASHEVVKALKRFRLSWMITRPSDEVGYVEKGSMKILVPPIIEIEDYIEEPSRAWVNKMVQHAVSHPFTLVDASLWERPSSEIKFLESLAEKTTWDNDELTLLLAEDLVKFISKSEYKFPSDHPIFETDFSRWVRTDKQRLAWMALSRARKVIQQYQNSGRADLKRLDAALEEIYLAESGTFLLALGQTEVPLTMNEKTFLATLANVYRLCGVPIPQNHDRWFALGGRTRGGRTSSKRDEPFFVEGVQKLTWNDPKEDDFGDGNFIYPTGKYPEGSFDLKSFSISWTESDVNFGLTLVDFADQKKNIVLPLIDIYFDVNRLAGAGAVDPLSKRGPVLIKNDAAWEYAVAVGFQSVWLYQAIPGQNPRKVSEITPVVDAGSKTIKFSLPRRQIRGEPKKWRMSVGLMGTETARLGVDPEPVTVLTGPTTKNFGGAVTGRLSPPYIDLLADTAKIQQNSLKPYRRGSKIQLPYIQAE